jgi:hypothetical protein
VGSIGGPKHNFDVQDLQMSQNGEKQNHTLDDLKKALAALATGLKLLGRFFAQLSSGFAGWPSASQRPQCGPEQSAQEEEEAREVRETRIREDQQARFRDEQARFWEDEQARFREDQRARFREDQRARFWEDQQARFWEDQQARFRDEQARFWEDQRARFREDEQARFWEDQRARFRDEQARFWEDQQVRIREDERRDREAAARLIRERAKTLNQANGARVTWEDELQRRQYDRGLDGPSIER